MNDLRQQQWQQKQAIINAGKIQTTTAVQQSSLDANFNESTKETLNQTTDRTETPTVANFENLLHVATEKTFRFLRKRNANNYNNNTDLTGIINNSDNSDNLTISPMHDATKAINAAITNMTNHPATEQATSAAYLETEVDDDFLNSNNLSATITSIRSNVTRVLYMYFQNVSDEYGYGAATTTTATTPTILLASSSSLHTSRPAHHHHGHHQQHQDPKSLLHINSTMTSSNPTLATATNFVQNLTNATASKAAVITSEYFQNSTYNSNNNSNSASNNRTSSELTNYNSNNTSNSNVLQTTLSHLNDMAKATASAVASAATATSATATAAMTTTTTKAPSITYPRYRIAIKSYENCSALFSNYTQPQGQGLFCNWTWDTFLCWPPTPAGVLARMHCPSGYHGIDSRNYANRKCELTGHWGAKPNETFSPNGWTDFHPCYAKEVQEILKLPYLELVVEIAQRTRTLEIVGLIISLVALISSLIIFCNFRSLRNNRTKIHRNLFIAMVLQVVIRLSLYLDQAFRRDKQEMATNASSSGIENTAYLCEASYILLEYARTAMFMWMFIEGWYLHNMVTMFQGRFPYTLFSLVGWGMPVIMTTIWSIRTAIYYRDKENDCWFNYNLTPYYWILEGPRIIVILTNFIFLLNIIRVLVMKLRESQASDIEQTRKAVRAAIVLLPLLGIINLLYLVPTLETPWKFALWSYVTHFLTSFQGFFIALLYCFLNGEVRAVLLKSLSVYMSARGHGEWVPKRASMYSGAFNTAPETENQQTEIRRNDSPKRSNGGRKASCSTVIHHQSNHKSPKIQISPRLSFSASVNGASDSIIGGPVNFGINDEGLQPLNNNNDDNNSMTHLDANSHYLDRQQRHGRQQSQHYSHHQQQQQHHQRHQPINSHNWMFTICFRGQKNKCVMSKNEIPPQIFMTTKMETCT